MVTTKRFDKPASQQLVRYTELYFIFRISEQSQSEQTKYIRRSHILFHSIRTRKSKEYSVSLVSISLVYIIKEIILYKRLCNPKSGRSVQIEHLSPEHITAPSSSHFGITNVVINTSVRIRIAVSSSNIAVYISRV